MRVMRVIQANEPHDLPVEKVVDAILKQIGSKIVYEVNEEGDPFWLLKSSQGLRGEFIVEADNTKVKM